MDNPITESNIRYIVSTLAIEDLKPSQEALDLCRELFEGKINSADAEKSIFAKYGINRAVKNGK